jgi:hypothetical protein
VSRSIEDLDPDIHDRARELLRVLDAKGIKYLVTCARRTVEEQLALFAQGRAELVVVQSLRLHARLRQLEDAENRYQVTKADGILRRSKHQDGRALDIVPVDSKGQPTWDYMSYAKQYREIAETARGLGWTCGADFPPVSITTMLGSDPPHYQI